MFFFSFVAGEGEGQGLNHPSEGQDDEKIDFKFETSALVMVVADDSVTLLLCLSIIMFYSEGVLIHHGRGKKERHGFYSNQRSA